MIKEQIEREQELPEVKISIPKGKGRLEAAEEYFGCQATPASELPQEAPSEEYLINIEED